MTKNARAVMLRCVALTNSSRSASNCCTCQTDMVMGVLPISDVRVVVRKPSDDTRLSTEMEDTTGTMTPKFHSPSRENRSAGTPGGPVPEETMQVSKTSYLKQTYSFIFETNFADKKNSKIQINEGLGDELSQQDPRGRPG